jgi:glycosyltransferase involved in cell wall biosynthesis
VQPDISIILATANGRDVLFECLESLLNQTYPLDKIELIIVDDNNDQRLAQSLKESECNKFLALKYIPLYHKGSAVARNTGIKNATSEILAFINDDCVADSDWVKLISETHRFNPDKPVVGGLTYVSECENTSLVSQFLDNNSIESGFNKKEIILFPAGNVSIKKRIFSEHLFNENFFLPGGEDLEFFWRIFKQGYRFIWNKDIKVVHARNSGLLGFLKQAYCYGRGNLLSAYLHKGEHPLLKDLRIGRVSFWLATLLSFIKIPGCSYLLAERLIKQEKIKSFSRKVSIYLLFILYKMLYLWGNICEFHKLSRNIKTKKIND